MKKRFTLSENDDGKRLYLSGPWELQVEIDHDDVDHEVVEKEAKFLTELLNKNWPINPGEIE